MLNIILIIIGVLVNAICIWSIKIILKDKDNLTWKSFLKYLLGIPVGALLSLLLFPLSTKQAMQMPVKSYRLWLILPLGKNNVPL